MLLKHGEDDGILFQANSESEQKLLKYKTINLDFNYNETHTWLGGTA